MLLMGQWFVMNQLFYLGTNLIKFREIFVLSEN